MSEQNPPENDSNSEATSAFPGLDPLVPPPHQGAGEPTSSLPPLPPAPTEAPAGSGKGKRRTAIIALVAVVVTAVLGGGAFAVWKVFFSGGPRPAEALPASTIAYLSIDLDPSAGQKIEAIKTFRKFPALKKNLGLETQDDLRKFLFEKITDAADCKDVSFDSDMKPWIGKRAAIAAVDLGDKDPAPAIAIQITDQKKAKAGFDKIAHCGDFGADFGFAVGEDYLIASDSASHAEKILEDGQKKPLSDDAAYKKWSDAAGDQGVVNFYVSKKASDYLTAGLDELKKSFVDGFNGNGISGGAGRLARFADCSDDPFATAKDQLKNFEGLAGSLRFADGGMELSMVASGVSQLASTGIVGPDVAKLPADSAIVAGIGIPKGYATTMFDSFKCGAGADADSFIKEAEQNTGLSLPGDLETLLGSALTLSLGGEPPADLYNVKTLGEVPVGLVVHGDATKIQALISKIEQTLGYQLADIPLLVKGSDSRIALSPSSGYGDTLLTDGTLGDSDNFKDAVPNADKASGILYINFDSKWRETLIQFAQDLGASESGTAEAKENTEPLKSFGLSTWTSGSTSHILLKLATN